MDFHAPNELRQNHSVGTSPFDSQDVEHVAGTQLGNHKQQRHIHCVTTTQKLQVVDMAIAYSLSIKDSSNGGLPGNLQ